MYISRSSHVFYILLESCFIKTGIYFEDPLSHSVVGLYITAITVALHRRNGIMESRKVECTKDR
jgi:hypothetical protein